MREKRIFQKAGLLGLLVIFMAGIFWGRPVWGKTAETDKVKVEIFFFNPCGSCREEEVYYEIAGEELKGLSEEHPYSVEVYNTFIKANKELYQKRLQELGLKEEDRKLPVMIVLDSAVSGQDEMKAQMRELVAGGSGKTASGDGESAGEEVPGPEPENLPADGAEVTAPEGLVLFTTRLCESCNRVKEMLRQEGIPFEETDISSEANVERVYQYFDAWQVPEEDQQVPVIFYAGGYFSGEEEIIGNKEALKQARAPEEGPEPGKAAPALLTFGRLTAAGLLNGLNPCAASMLLMLISVCISSGKDVLKTGLSYLLARFIAYFFMGSGLYGLFSVFQTGFPLKALEALRWVFFAAAVVLALLNFLDFLSTVQKKYEKVRVQLPVGLRKFNHNLIRRLSGSRGKWWLPAVFGLGLVISVGEFFCTGQIYAASVAYIFKTSREMWLYAAACLILYIVAMCVPHLLLICILHKGSSVTRSTQFVLTHMWLVKLFNSILFAVFAVWFLVQ